jgi:putative hydrolase of the HAD superfamily
VHASSTAAWRAPARDGAPIEVVAFDLDNTLYDESQYFAAAFAAIAPVVAARAGVDAKDVVRRLEARLEEKGRHYHHLFDDVLAELGLDPRAYLAELLSIFRRVSAPLALFPGARELLEDLGRTYRLGLITSGMQAVQENKLHLLGIAGSFERVVFSSSLAENKPSPLPFRTLLAAMGVEPARAVYVGDNPLFDFRGANEIGMLTVRVRNREFDGTNVAPEADGRVQVACIADVRGLFL